MKLITYTFLAITLICSYSGALATSSSTEKTISDYKPGMAPEIQEKHACPKPVSTETASTGSCRMKPPKKSKSDEGNRPDAPSDLIANPYK